MSRVVTECVTERMHTISVVYGAGFAGNLEKPANHRAFKIFCISSFRPLDKYLAYAVGSLWNAAVSWAEMWMLGQGERAPPRSEGSRNRRINFLEQPCHCGLAVLGIPQRMLWRKWVFSNTEIWPCILGCGWRSRWIKGDGILDEELMQGRNILSVFWSSAPGFVGHILFEESSFCKQRA